MIKRGDTILFVFLSHQSFPQPNLPWHCFPSSYKYGFTLLYDKPQEMEAWIFDPWPSSLAKQSGYSTWMRWC
jgi:hypothetical protein